MPLRPPLPFLPFDLLRRPHQLDPFHSLVQPPSLLEVWCRQNKRLLMNQLRKTVAVPELLGTIFRHVFSL